MAVIEREGFEESVVNLRKLSKQLEAFEKIKLTLLDEITFRLSFSMNAWPPSGIISELPKEKMEKLPSQLKKLLEIFYELNKEIEKFYKKVKDDGEITMGAYLEIRKNMISVIMDIRRGMIKESVRQMKNAVSLLRAHLQREGEFPKGYSKNFWERYGETKDYFESMFLMSFPDEYDPSNEPVYSAALTEALKLEKDSIDFALRGDFLDAIESLNALYRFMEGFTQKQNTRIIPKRTI